ncbi:MAG: hypothetical protein Q7K43_03615 [Candidatus Woesearchaeota archaeon]|nr:hypothetical protein [Candidatus Woesearchaeota archaeon]
MSFTIKHGYLYAYFCFDVAREISLDKIKSFFGRTPETSQFVCERLMPEHVRFKTAPLLVRLGRETILGQHVDIKAKVYDFGVVSLIYQIPLNGSIASIAELMKRVAESKDLAARARQKTVLLMHEIAIALVKPKNELSHWEDYFVLRIHELDKKLKASDLLEKHGKDIAALLRCETELLSNWELDNAIKYPLSYYENELVVVDWNAAFIYDPRQSYDVQDVLEYAVIELLELRAYDDVLDKSLEQAYVDLDKKETFALVPYDKTTKYLVEVKLDVTEVLDRLNDQLKLIGDLYLSKVYHAASQRFYVEQLKTSLNEKLKAAESIYNMLFERANNRLLMMLEWIMVALFVVEIVILLLWWFYP